MVDLSPDASRDAPALREAFLAAGYTLDGVPDRLGTTAALALERGESVPARLVTAGLDPLDTCIRLFLLTDVVPEPAAAAALPLQTALGCGLLERVAEGVRAAVDVRPYGQPGWYVASDHAAGLDGRTTPLPRDHVLGVGAASTTLAQVTVRPDVERALDLGTGCGVQALHLTTHARQVVASDVSPRALAFARFTAALSEVDWQTREGSLFEPVAGERFDLVVSNPPFVVSPGDPSGRAHTYRDSGMPADGVSAALVSSVPEYLTDGGWCQLLANWVVPAGVDWRERVASWVVPTGCEAWVVQREVTDPAQYVAMWLRDSAQEASPTYREQYDRWLRWFVDQRIEGVGFGWVVLHASGSADQVVRLEDRREGPLPSGDDVLAWFDRQEWLRATPDGALLDARLRTSPGVSLRQELRPGPAGWQPEVPRVHLDGGVPRDAGIDPVGIAVLAGCDGSAPLREVLVAAAAANALDPSTVLAGGVAAVRGLVEDGYLLPPIPRR